MLLVESDARAWPTCMQLLSLSVLAQSFRPRKTRSTGSATNHAPGPSRCLLLLRTRSAPSIVMLRDWHRHDVVKRLVASTWIAVSTRAAVVFPHPIPAMSFASSFAAIHTRPSRSAYRNGHRSARRSMCRDRPGPRSGCPGRPRRHRRSVAPSTPRSTRPPAQPPCGHVHPAWPNRCNLPRYPVVVAVVSTGVIDTLPLRSRG